MCLHAAQGDVCNPQLVNHIFITENIDVIFHLAAKTHVGEQPPFRFHFISSSVQFFIRSFFFPPESSFEIPSVFQRVNIDGTRVLLDAAHRARHQPQRFVYVSTDEVYGTSLDEVSEVFIFIFHQVGFRIRLRFVFPFRHLTRAVR